MTDKQKRKLVTNHLQTWIDRLNLRHFRVDVSMIDRYHPDDSDSERIPASINVLHHYLKAHINIWKGFWDLTPPEQEQALVHELVHIITAPADDALYSAHKGSPYPPQIASKLIETLTEHVARVIAEAYPA